MKYLTINPPVKVPVKDCEGCEYLDTWSFQQSFCDLFPTKNYFQRKIYNNRPCKQCREARGEK